MNKLCVWLHCWIQLLLLEKVFLLSGGNTSTVNNCSSETDCAGHFMIHNASISEGNISKESCKSAVFDSDTNTPFPPAHSLGDYVVWFFIQFSSYLSKLKN